MRFANRLKPTGIVLIAVLLAAGAGIALFELAGGNDTMPAVASPGEDTLPSAVAALGRIEPESGLLNVSTAAPDVLHTLLVQLATASKRTRSWVIFRAMPSRWRSVTVSARSWTRPN